MGILSKIFSVGDVEKPIEAVAKGLDALFTSDEERLDKQILIERLRQQPHLAQNMTNNIEAAHRSIFVAGWRPFIGWVCGFNLLYITMLRDWVVIYFSRVAPEIVIPPPVMADMIVELVMAMLGLGALRTYEKIKGEAQ